MTTADRLHRVVDYDAELRLLTEAFWRAVGIRGDDHILDVGCGAGQTTREAARIASAGGALGVDISSHMIERARALARAEGLRNVAFEHADAQVRRFPEKRFDIAISRFGAMFFADPVAAFANIGRALRPAGRLAMIVWQPHEANEWSVSIERSLDPRGGADTSAPGPEFSLAHPGEVEAILTAAGFSEVTFMDVNEPVYYGRDVTAALEWVRGFASTREALERLDAVGRAHALQRMRETLAAHLGEQGVWFNSRAWIVQACRQ